MININKFGDSFNESLNTFLKSWHSREEYIGAMMMGSFANGLYDEYSDIDLYIFFKPGTDFHERGNIQVGKYMIEYCARTVDLTKNIILEQDPKQYKKQCSRHFLKGIILEDETGEISKLKDFAIQQFYKPIERNTDQEWVEMSKYIIWGAVNKIKNLYTTKDAGFSYGYFYTLSLIIDTYGKFLGAEVLKPYYDVYNFLTDKDFCDKYLIKQFPDEVFIDSFLNCLKKEDVVELEELNNYVMNKMGGFNIDGWILKMKL